MGVTRLVRVSSDPAVGAVVPVQLLPLVTSHFCSASLLTCSPHVPLWATRPRPKYRERQKTSPCTLAFLCNTVILLSDITRN